MNLVKLTLSDTEILYRLMGRSICQNNNCQRVYSLHRHSALQPLKAMTCNECESALIRRSDDEEVAVRERLRIYHEHEQGMLDFFSGVGHRIHSLRADTALEDVYEELLSLAGYAHI